MSNKLPAVTAPPKKGKLPPVQLPAVTNGQQLSAVARAPHPIKALHKFADRAENLKEHYGRLNRALKNMGRVLEMRRLVDAQKYLDEASAGLSWHDNYCRGQARQLQQESEIFDPAEAYDDDGDVIEARVWAHIGLLLSSYNANSGNEEAYVGAMVGEVLTVQFSEVALKLACSQLRKKLKFLPTTAEVIEAIEEQQELWADRSSAISCCDEVAEELREKLKVATELEAADKVKREEERRAREEKKRADDELRAKPLAVGDRVKYRSQPFRLYTIIGILGDASFWTWSDTSNDTAWVGGPEIERAIPGDYNYEMSEDVRAALQRKLDEIAREALREQRPVVGDRVVDAVDDFEDVDRLFEDIDRLHGAGTVVFAGDFEPGGFDDGFTIQFDDGALGVNYMPDCLRRLLPGDAEFERPESAVIGWQQWELRRTTGEPASAPPCEMPSAATTPQNSTGDVLAQPTQGSGE
jgi:hypothetical protein